MSKVEEEMSKNKMIGVDCRLCSSKLEFMKTEETESAMNKLI